MFFRALALLCLVGVAHAQTNTLFRSGNVITGNTWHAPQDAGSGTSGEPDPRLRPVDTAPLDQARQLTDGQLPHGRLGR
jgi:hypothetical protein